MLLRSAGRRRRHETARLLDACFAQLNLPWLAPAQLRWSATHASVASPASARVRRRSLSRSRQLPALSRHLATAHDQYTPSSPSPYPLPPGYNTSFRSRQDINIPWDISQSSDPKPSVLRPYHDPIIINTSIQTPGQTIKVTHGVQGTVKDLLHHLHTAIQIGRLPRAATIIQRLGDICTSDSPELVHAHTAYLEESLRLVALRGRGAEGEKALAEMQKWFETEMRKKSVSLDAKILVIMIRASIRALNGKEQARTIRRYAKIANGLGEETYEEVLDSEDYDDNEFTILGRVTYEEPSTAHTTEIVEIEPPDPAPKAQYRRPDAIAHEDVPQVLITSQRGEGLASVKRALNELAVTPGLPAEASIESQQEQAYKRQRSIEENSVEVAVDRWRKADEELRKIGIHTSLQSKPLTALMWKWYEALLPVLEAELAECRKLLSKPTTRRDHDRYHYGPYLELLPISKVAALTILHTVTQMPQNRRDKRSATEKYRFEQKLGRLTTSLAGAIRDECVLESSKTKSVQQKGNRSRSNFGSKQLRRTKKAKKASKAEQKKQELMASLEWPQDTKVQFGAMLVAKLLETAQLPVTRPHPRTKEKITQMQPAFLHRVQYEHGKRVGMLVANPALMKKFESEPLGSFLAKRMPMVVEPKPWTEWANGGYIHYSNPVLRLPRGDASGKDYFIAAQKRGDTDQVFAGLNALGEVPWKVHHRVFKVQLEAWNSGEAIGKLAPLNPKLDLPPQPNFKDDASAKAKWLADMQAAENKRTGLHSQRCFQNFQLETARSMINETMWFPHNVDFRGRAYPIPPYLNHMGADTVRGLLVFARGKPLGAKGVTWLKIHLATVAGHDKASLSERIVFTEKHLDDIYDSASKPLNGRRWWLESDDPWQTLAACFELTEALDSPDPTKFISHLPVQQDGTCNGLQHYAALGGDKIGAAQVNLEPGDRPADVYTAVASAVIEEVHQDALQGNILAQKLDGNITRKCVKQPVMTHVYGVTFFGAKEQVQRQLEVIIPGLRAYEEINYITLATYIATKIFKSLGTMFTGAQAIQQWLGQCADRISQSITPEQITELTASEKAPPKTKKRPGRKSKKDLLQASKQPDAPAGSYNWDVTQMRDAKLLFKTTVVWTTPLRLPVVQPYRSANSKGIKTLLQHITLHDPQVWHPVSKRKQLQAFPPNFIHSLDATHMMLSALRCKELGITFASIHDSFWTHACDVDRMSVALRDAFVQMHKEDIIGRLREEFQTRYKGCMYFNNRIATSSAVGRKITQHRKEAKLAHGEELAMEMKRLQLLASEDPKERAEGESMVTPASILAGEANPGAFQPPDEVSDQRLGSILAETASETAVDEGDEAGDNEVVEARDEGDVEDAVAVAQDGNHPESDKGSKDKKKHRTAAKKYVRKIYVWQPLTFPEVPPKGEFDVRKIKESNYFFH